MTVCSLYESNLSDSITLTIDQAGNLLGVAITGKTSQCKDISLPDSRLSTFNTTVTIISPMNGPAPDTQTYIQRLEQEKAEKARGEQGDNRSFLAKYWMYIVPLLIFLLISGASGPEGQVNAR
ncbi:ER membrane protein complex subunit 10-like [Centruroides sculpturatus]|uniref:ER membrane protein complex subunit 10-like n=1 Tax=Centruroides sculpturatus TaxID=218467 RepID=UPI000C6EA101|nr:ER membrane protein complex subunit 10-like [Centruroides sculpturatus]